MTPVERHAELVHAESLYQKSLLGIVYSGDWLAFIQEVLNMHTIISIYRQLGKWFETIDAAYAIAHPEQLTVISTPNPALETGTDIEETPPQSSTTISTVFSAVNVLLPMLLLDVHRQYLLV
ncbi:hypothetical protein BD769DRAFT_96404 [Suillus cothurnatus]|nr:hypothetical protein BD769DRAFT_96404 [Suillus cothurnatus]